MQLVNQGQKHPESNYSETWHSSGLVLKHRSSVSFCCVCREHKYTHTHIHAHPHTYTLLGTLKMHRIGSVLHKQLFLAIQFIYRCCHDNQSFILQIPGSCPWWGIVITTPPRDSKNHRSLSYQTQGINTHTQKIPNVSKSSTFLPFDLFPLHPLTLLHAKHTHTAGILLM